jgi:hypothetical protein
MMFPKINTFAVPVLFRTGGLLRTPDPSLLVFGAIVIEVLDIKRNEERKKT